MAAGPEQPKLAERRVPFVRHAVRVVAFHAKVNPPDALADRRKRRYRDMKPASGAHWTE